MNTDAVRQRLKEWLAAFGPPQIAAIAILGVLAIILAVWFLRWSTAPTWEPVSSGLRPEQAADIVDELDKASISNRLSQGGTTVEVPTSRIADARVVLGQAGVLTGRIEGYEILDRQGFTTSSFQQRIAYQRAIEGELQRTIMSMDRVTSVSVHLAIPEERLFSEQQRPTRASVVVGGDIDSGTVTSIVNIVASSVPGLEAGDVTVADTRGRVLSSLDDGAFGQDQRLKMRQAMEASLETDIETLLAGSLGVGRAIPRVSIEMNFDEAESETITYDTENAVPLRQQTVEEAYTGNGAVPNGALGVIEDVADAGQIASDGDSTYLRREGIIENGVASTRTVSRQAPGRIERITVGVIIDENLENAPPIRTIESLVSAAAGLDPERGDSIVVTAIPFDDTVVPELATEVSAGSGSGSIATYVTTGVSALAVLLALLFLRRGLRNLGAPFRDDPRKDGRGGAGRDVTTELVLPAASGAPTGLVDVTAAGAAALPEGQLPTTTILELIDQQPDEVANLLRGWMAESRN